MIYYGLIFIFACGFVGSLAAAALRLSQPLDAEGRAPYAAAMVACAVAFAVGIASIVEKI